MAKQKQLSKGRDIFAGIVIGIIVIVFTIFFLKITSPEGADELKIFRNRLFVSLACVISGFIFLKLKNMGKKLTPSLKYVGEFLLITGIVIIFASLFLHFLLGKLFW